MSKCDELRQLEFVWQPSTVFREKLLQKTSFGPACLQGCREYHVMLILSPGDLWLEISI